MQARAAGGDGLDMGDTCGRFDNDFKADRLLTAFGAFDRGDQRVHCINILGAAHLGDHDLIKPRARLFHQIHHIAIPIGCIQPVDAHAQGLSAPINRIDRLDHIGAGLILV